MTPYFYFLFYFIKKFVGVAEDFLIRTNNKAVKDLFTNKRNIIEGRRLKWYNTNSNYSFEVEFIKDSNNFIADYLIRYHCEELLNMQSNNINFYARIHILRVHLRL
jgi:hypothetical protein